MESMKSTGRPTGSEGQPTEFYGIFYGTFYPPLSPSSFTSFHRRSGSAAAQHGNFLSISLAIRHMPLSLVVGTWLGASSYGNLGSRGPFLISSGDGGVKASVKENGCDWLLVGKVDAADPAACRAS